MLFNSFSFLVFFPIVVGLYFIIPSKYRQFWLLIASYYFYMNWNAVYAILILGITIIGYIGGILLERAEERRDKDNAVITARNRRLCMVICAVISLGVLFTFKYLNFAVDNINHLFRLLGSSVQISNSVSLVLPVGISFYTFQALGYIIDVYRKDVPAEKSFMRYALFVSFFPQLVAGPIERYRTVEQEI